MQPRQARTRRNSTNFHAHITLAETLEKKLMSRLVPKNASARMATFSTTTAGISNTSWEARGHEHACCGGRDPARDFGSHVSARDRGARRRTVAQQVQDARHGRGARP